MHGPSPVHPGDLVDGKYRIEEVLGVGGMGVVVRAMHEKLGRPVAIKFLLGQLLGNAPVVQRFEREARSMARLKSEHIIDVLDVGRLPSGEPFIVMELLHGSDLAKHIEGGRQLPTDEAVELVLQICEGVADAHAAGIIHRDLKPQNVFVTTRRDGRPLLKVLDFGISKVTGESQGALTGTADMLGSPSYMSPEQLLATRDAGPGTDVWALGIILYQLLGGILPFRGDTLAQICVQIINAPHVPLSQLRPDTPPWLVDVVEACLRKDPAQRLPSVDALSTMLRARGASGTQMIAGVAATALAVTPPPGALPTRTMLHSVPAEIPGVNTNVGWGHVSEGRAATGDGARLFYIAGACAVFVVLVGAGFGVFHFARSDRRVVPAASAPLAAVASEPPPVVAAPASASASAEPAPPVPAAAAAPAIASAPVASAPVTSAKAGAGARPTGHGATKGTDPGFVPPTSRK